MQLRHLLDNDAPTVVEYVPAIHPTHAAVPATLANVPATHDAQVPASDAPIVGEYVPIAQLRH